MCADWYTGCICQWFVAQPVPDVPICIAITNAVYRCDVHPLIKPFMIPYGSVSQWSYNSMVVGLINKYCWFICCLQVINKSDAWLRGSAIKWFGVTYVTQILFVKTQMTLMSHMRHKWDLCHICDTNDFGVGHICDTEVICVSNAAQMAIVSHLLHKSHFLRFLGLGSRHVWNTMAKPLQPANTNKPPTKKALSGKKAPFHSPPILSTPGWGTLNLGWKRLQNPLDP